MSSVDWRKLGAWGAVALLLNGQRGGSVSITPLQAAAALGSLYLAPNCCSKGKSPAQLPSLTDAEADFDADLDELDKKYKDILPLLAKHIGKEHNFAGVEGGRNKQYAAAAKGLSNLLKEGLITAKELHRFNAEKVFWIHRRCAPIIAGGIAVRFTVQLNLFGGTVANLGNERQRNQLDEIFSRGELGCFALTEEAAGVLSGLVVETTATWNKAGTYTLHTPNEQARKFWISSGLESRWAVVIARLMLPVKGTDEVKDHGPHAFLVDLHNTKGVKLEDMEAKTQFNDLDNAYISFDNSEISHDTLLAEISYVTEEGEYKLSDPNKPYKFEDVAQRLLSGRLCISLAGLTLMKETECNIRTYDRKIFAGKDQKAKLVDLPSMKCALDESRRVNRVLQKFTDTTLKRFCTEKTISANLVEHINCAKILIMRFAIDNHMHLKGKVGAKALQDSGPFGGKTDLLYVFQFAEGDSGILKQKMARDALTRTIGSPARLLTAIFYTLFGVGLQQRVSSAALSLAWNMQGAKGSAKMKRWFNQHEKIEQLAIGHVVLLVRQVAARNGASKSDLAAFDNWFNVHCQ